MQLLAREIGFSETTFVLPDDRVRIFTPGAELPFAGHPVLGTAFVLAIATRRALRSRCAPARDPSRSTFDDHGRGTHATAAAVGVRLGPVTPTRCSPRSASPARACRSRPTSTARRTCTSCSPSTDEVAGLRPDIGRLARYCSRRSTISCVAGEGTSWKSRVFGPGPRRHRGSRDGFGRRPARRAPVPPRRSCRGGPRSRSRRASSCSGPPRCTPWRRGSDDRVGVRRGRRRYGRRRAQANVRALKGVDSHMALNGLRVISADSHVLEPHDLWTSRMANGPFADRAPHMVEHDNHGHLFIIDGPEAVPDRARRRCGQVVRRAAGERRHRRHAAVRRLGPGGAARRHGHRRRRRRSALPVDRDDARAVEGPRLPARVHPRRTTTGSSTTARPATAGSSASAMIPTIDPDAAVDEIERAARRRACAARWCRASRPRVTTPRRASTRCGRRSRMRTGRCRSTSSPARAAAIPTLGSGLGMLTVMSVVQQVQQTLALLIFGRVFDRHPTSEGRVGRARRRLGRALLATGSTRCGSAITTGSVAGRRDSSASRASTCATTCGSRSRRIRWRSRRGTASARPAACGPATTRTPTRRGRTA